MQAVEKWLQSFGLVCFADYEVNRFRDCIAFCATSPLFFSHCASSCASIPPPPPPSMYMYLYVQLRERTLSLDSAKGIIVRTDAQTVERMFGVKLFSYSHRIGTLCNLVPVLVHSYLRTCSPVPVLVLVPWIVTVRTVRCLFV